MWRLWRKIKCILSVAVEVLLQVLLHTLTMAIQCGCDCKPRTCSTHYRNCGCGGCLHCTTCQAMYKVSQSSSQGLPGTTISSPHTLLCMQMPCVYLVFVCRTSVYTGALHVGCGMLPNTRWHSHVGHLHAPIHHTVASVERLQHTLHVKELTVC